MKMRAGKMTLVLGGARSGKSSFAQRLAEKATGELIYIATAQAFDGEMAARIARHQAERGPRWQTVECPVNLGGTIAVHQEANKTILVDCLTLWLNNLMLGDHNIEAAISSLKTAIVGSASHIIMVSNEVGQGIVPDNALARRFRDEAGWLNQALATIADDVWVITAGIPQPLKIGMQTSA
jgi:adenosylcobinamide kinase / adenosylcobinamide-phosphate guanylyltransferase